MKIMLIFFSLDGYDFFHRNRNNKKGGGVALYINNRIQYQIIDNLSIDIDNCLECMTEIIAKAKCYSK